MSGRTQPLSGSDISRIGFAAANRLLPRELHTTTQYRAFLSNVLLAPVWQAGVADEAAMLALDSTAARGCFPMDACFREDTFSVWLCLTNRGELLTDWVELGGGGGTSDGGADARTVWLMG